MGDRRHVLDHVDLQAGSLQGTDGGLTSGARALDVDLDGLQAVLHSGLRGGLRSGLRGERRGLLAAAETESAGGSPAQRVALGIGQGHDGVVKGGADMRRTALHDLALAALADDFLQLLLRCHCQSLLYYLVAFFLPAMVFFGPLRVRAFCLVFWPRTGRPLR